MRGQHRVQAISKVNLLQLARTDVDADRDVKSGCAPRRDPRQGVAQHPFAHADCQRVIFDIGQEGRRSQQTPLGMLPSNQRLDAEHRAAAHIDLGLIVQDELALHQRGMDLVDALMMAAHAAIELGVENVNAVLATQLGDIHRLIRVAQQLVRVDRLRLREKSQSQAGRHLHSQAVDVHRLGRFIEQPGQKLQGHFLIAQIQQQGDKLIAANAGKGIAFAQHLLHILGQSDQQLVTDLVPVAIVDVLESVKIHVGQRQHHPAAGFSGHRLGQTIGQQHPVRQICQGIIVREMFKLSCVRLKRSDIREQRHVMR